MGGEVNTEHGSIYGLYPEIFRLELLAFKVGAWLIDTVLRGFWPIDPMLLRLAKLGRLLRLMRLVRKLKGFDALYILTTALQGSVTVGVQEGQKHHMGDSISIS